MEQKPGNGSELPAKEPPKKTSRYEQITAQIAKLQREKLLIEHRRRAEERKARSRRLIEIGALTLKHFSLPTDILPEEVAVILHQVAPRQEAGLEKAEPPKK